MNREPNPYEFRRVWRAVTGDFIEPDLCAMAIDAVERNEATMAERIVYRQVAEAECGFCLDLPVGNARRWTDAGAPAVAPCPRCGETYTLPNPEAS